MNNAAFQRTHDKPAEIPKQEFFQTFRTNVFGTFYLSQFPFSISLKGVASSILVRFRPLTRVLICFRMLLPKLLW